MKSGGRLREAVFILGHTAVECRVSRLGVANSQPRASAAVRRRVDPRVVVYVNTVPLPSTYSRRAAAAGDDGNDDYSGIV